jgi:Ca-activated chloride channel homolog
MNRFRISAARSRQAASLCILRLCGFLALVAFCVASLRADTGVLVPLDRQTPDPSILSLTEMQVDIRIDNGDARVWVRQVFTNHTSRIEEGNYLFALPGGTQVSDFAVWDGPVRIPAVILERKRANALYQDLKSQAIDPGLLQQGERTEDDARNSSVFSAHIVPIPPYGTKRLELEYHQQIPVDAHKSYFVLPLKPDAYSAQKVTRLVIHFELDTAAQLEKFAAQGKQLPFKIEQQDDHTVRGSIDATNVDLTEDFAATWKVNEPANSLEVIAYRNPHASAAGLGPDLEPPAATDSKAKNPKKSSEPGYFEATAQFTAQSALAPAATVQGPGRIVVVLMDTSLSMQWEKLERSYAAAARLLESLRPDDHFNLLLFNTRVDTFRPAPVAADPATVSAAMDWLRSSHLRGGTDLEKALDAGLAQIAAPGSSSNSALVLLSDGGADRGVIQISKLAALYQEKWKQLPIDHRPKTDVFAVGDDANLPLLRLLSSNDGMMEHVLSTEPADFKIATFVGRVGQSPISDLQLSVSSHAVDMVYPIEDAVFDGGEMRWVGLYDKPVRKASFHAEGRYNGQALAADTKAELPAEALDHDQLPRLWAWARVQALLAQIDREGETDAAVNEIIRLARQYKFVTPYTSFLAAPRALLRPRVIRPGDPVLRIHTDPSIVSVIALFPFGLEKPLRRLADDDEPPAADAPRDLLWQTRFLAPPEMKDGVYSVRLILRDNEGHLWREAKSFVIASTPPTVKVHLIRTRFRAGEIVPLTVTATQSTRTLTARIDNLAPVTLRWNPDASASTGQVPIPAGLPAGDYTLTVTGEDIAHNLGSAEVRIEIVP